MSQQDLVLDLGGLC